MRAEIRSASPPSPPRFPTWRQRSARSTTCTPLRRSHVRSSKPCSGPCGCSTVATSDTRALWRGAAGRQLEESRLVHALGAEAKHRDGHAQAVARLPRRGGHLDERALGRADARSKDAPIERAEPDAPPPPPCARECRHEHCEPPFAVREGRGGREHHGPGGKSDPGHARGIRRRDTDAQGGHERMRRAQVHGATSLRSWSRRAGPMPGIASSSSTLEKAPCCCR